MHTYMTVCTCVCTRISCVEAIFYHLTTFITERLQSKAHAFYSKKCVIATGFESLMCEELSVCCRWQLAEHASAVARRQPDVEDVSPVRRGVQYGPRAGGSLVIAPLYNVCVHLYGNGLSYVFS